MGLAAPPGGTRKDLEVAFAQALAYAEAMGLDALERTQARTLRQREAYTEFIEEWPERVRAAARRERTRAARPPAANTRQWQRSSAAHSSTGS